MKEVLDYLRQIIKNGFEKGKVDGHGFFAGFPQPYKNKTSYATITLLYYACIFLVENAEDYLKDIDKGPTYDFLKDETLKTKPWRTGKSRISQWNLWELLKVVKKEIE